MEQINESRARKDIPIQKLNETLSSCLSNKDLELGRITEPSEAYDIKILNVAGPRESNTNGIYQKTLDFLRYVFHN